MIKYLEKVKRKNLKSGRNLLKASERPASIFQGTGSSVICKGEKIIFPCSSVECHKPKCLLICLCAFWIFCCVKDKESVD
jgi:hypothetical protein